MALSEQSDNEQQIVPGVALKALALWFLVLMTCCCGLAAQEDIEQPTPPPGDSDSSYTLGPGDRIKISIFNQDDLSGQYVLDGDGRFSMPLIGSVQAAGLSPSDLEALLVSKLKPDYLVNPRVSVRIQNFRPFYIIGEVKSPSSYAYVDGMTYLTAVAISGGFTYRAKKDRVYVVRGDDPDREEIKLEVNDRVRPGDIIRIAERLF
jgi:protein involved in polysaccharide export with SLBB domain